MIRRSKFSVSPACHNQVTWLATSAQNLRLLAVAKSKQLCQAPRQWCHNATPWLRHLQNITGFRNLELDTLSDVKSTGKYSLNFVFLTSRYKHKTVQLRDTVHQLSLGRSGGLYHVTTQFYYYIYTNEWPLLVFGPEVHLVFVISVVRCMIHALSI